MYDLLKLAAFLRAKDIRSQDPEAFSTIISALKDFNQNKQFLYAGIIYDNYISNNIPLEEAIHDSIVVLKTFEQIKSHLEKKDIQQYQSYNELATVVNKANLQRNTRQSKKIQSIDAEDQQKAIENSNVTKIFEDVENVVYRINDRFGSQALGKDTPWCITKTGPYFEHYTANNLIFYFSIDKTRDPSDPLQKVAIHVIRNPQSSKIEEVKVTKKTNDGDNNPIEIVPGYEKFVDILKQDAEAQPEGLVAKIANNMASLEEVERYWGTLDPVSYAEKHKIMNAMLKKYSFPRIDFFIKAYNKSDAELYQYVQQYPADAAIMEILANKTQDQKLLSHLYGSNYPNVQEEVAGKTNDIRVMRDAANSTYNKVKMGLIWNSAIPVEYMEHIRDNFENDGSYFISELFVNDKALIQSGIRWKRKDPELLERYKKALQVPAYAYEFVKSVPGANIPELQKAVMNSPEYACAFAKSVPGANIPELQKAVMNSPAYAYEFARSVPGANIPELQKAVMNSLEYAFLFARYVPGANIPELQKVVMSSPAYAYKFAKYVPGANIQELWEVVKNTHFENDFRKIPRFNEVIENKAEPFDDLSQKQSNSPEINKTILDNSNVPIDAVAFQIDNILKLAGFFCKKASYYNRIYCKCKPSKVLKPKSYWHGTPEGATGEGRLFSAQISPWARIQSFDGKIDRALIDKVLAKDIDIGALRNNVYVLINPDVLENIQEEDDVSNIIEVGLRDTSTDVPVAFIGSGGGVGGMPDNAAGCVQLPFSGPGQV